MQLQLVRATREARPLDEIVNAFTPPMRRVCRHMADAALREMVERMAMHQMAEEQRCCGAPGAHRGAKRYPKPRSVRIVTRRLALSLVRR